MRGPILAFLSCIAFAAPALSQPATGPAVPARIGNRANGKDYQPAPDVVVPSEKAAGVLPNIAHQQAENRAVESIDRDALSRVGQSTQSVPHMATGQQ